MFCDWITFLCTILWWQFTCRTPARVRRRYGILPYYYGSVVRGGSSAGGGKVVMGGSHTHQLVAVAVQFANFWP